MDEKIGYVLGFLEATIGSNRSYTLDDLKRRIKIAAKLLRDEDDVELQTLMKIDSSRQIELDRVQ
jgi:hypothetical protein